MARIVVGVDESSGAANALRWALRDAVFRGAEVEAVLAWGYLDQHGSRADQFEPSYGEEDALTALDRAVVTAVGIDDAAEVARRVVCDLAAPALLDAATGADLLVVGARGLGGFKGLLLGSVSQHCVSHAPCPVAVIRGDQEVAPAAPEQIVVAIDGSDAARRALEWAAEEARLRRARLRAVTAWHMPHIGDHVFSAPALGDSAIYREAAERIVDDALASIDPAGIDGGIDVCVMSGAPSAAVLEAARDADLLVAGSRGLGGFKGLLLGSVSAQLVHHAACPIVVVPL